jgi:ABC-2 type transport system ATP-binding protein
MLCFDYISSVKMYTRRFMNDTVLEVKNLTKTFGTFTAVDNISFTLKKGEMLGLLGINGAGKTTTIQMLLGVLLPTSGEIFYFNKSLKSHRSEIMEEVNFSSTYTDLPWNLTVWENLHFISYLYDIKNRKQRIKKIAEIFQLEEIINKRTGSLSAGQKTRVNLAKGFINFPKVLLLDEPTASLDVEIANTVRKFLLEEKREFNISMILTSHNMSEVEEMCDRVIFINQGKIIADDTPENLAKSIQIAHVQLRLEKNEEKILEYGKKNNLSIHKNGKYFDIDIQEKNIPSLLHNLAQKNILYNEISIQKPTLEDYFFQVLSKEKK